MQHGLNSLEAQDGCRGCREQRTIFRGASNQAEQPECAFWHRTKYYGVPARFNAFWAFWRGERTSGAVNDLSKWQKLYSPELSPEP